MADHAVDDFDGDIFIYRGGRAPQHVTHVLIDRSIDEIEDKAFWYFENLVQVDTHDGLRKIGKYAFFNCRSLRRINLKSVVEIDEQAFHWCKNLELVEFGERLEIIGYNAFDGCTSLKTSPKLPSIITIGQGAFGNCKHLIDIQLSERLETIGVQAFYGCDRLQRISIPLKRDLFPFDYVWRRYSQFDYCDQLTTVDLVGGIHETVASLHMESWRTEMIAEINRINQVLYCDKGGQIKQWLEMVLDKMNHYKVEHCRYVKEGITLLELALWKAKLDEKEEYAAEGKTSKTSGIARKDKRMTCGADMVINNVLPFLQLE